MALSKLDKEMIDFRFAENSKLYEADKVARITAKQMSHYFPPWKRQSIYAYCKSKPEYNTCEIELDGVRSIWEVILYYDGYQIFENMNRTEILITIDAFKRIELFRHLKISNAEYTVFVEKYNCNGYNILDHLDDLEIPNRIVYQKFFDFDDEGPMVLKPFTADLYETEPELFI